jgi:hypothetical protein
MPLQPKKINRDYPLAPTSEPVTFQDELIKRNVSGTSQKLMEENKKKERKSIQAESKQNDSIENKTMNEIRYKKMKEDMQNMAKQSLKARR